MTEEEALFWSQAITREQILPGSDLARVAGAKRGGEGRREKSTKEGKGKGAPARRAGVFVIRPCTIFSTNPIM